jgi:hypothetical protein
MSYVTAETVKQIACADASALGLTASDYDSLLTVLIKWACGEINTFLARSYTDTELSADSDMAAALESVAAQAVDNFLLSIVQRKNSPIINVNDFAVSSPRRIILTEDMKNTIRRYKTDTISVPVFTEGVMRFTDDATALIKGVD